MKISFPKYGVGELITRKRGAIGIISFVAIAFLLVCGSYLLGNKLLLAIVVLGFAGILLCLRAAAAIFPDQNKVVEAPSAFIEENVSRISSQWDYRPTKARRACAALDGPSTEASDGLSSDPFGINDNVRFDFGKPEPTVQDATTRAPIQDDACAFSRYD